LLASVAFYMRAEERCRPHDCCAMNAAAIE
jgi:hypothetical protein